jgi:hypothetical protein
LAWASRAIEGRHQDQPHADDQTRNKSENGKGRK